MPRNGARVVTVTLLLDEDRRNPWNEGTVTKWLRDNLDFKEDVVAILDIHFPEGVLGDLTDEDIEP